MIRDSVLSCIQPTGAMHIGNFFGAIQNWVELQKNYDCKFGIVDYHAMTVSYDPKDLENRVIEMAISLIACGVSVENLFIQSLIPEHTELAWIFSCLVTTGELDRQTQYKDKKESDVETEKLTVGFYNYPVLQGADILIYKANKVPVGKDQKQHIELSRTLARRFNHRFNTNIFLEPEPLFTKTPKIKSLLIPSKKMSKSLGDKNYIGCFESISSIQKKVLKAKTDTGDDKENISEGVLNLIQIIDASGHQELADKYLEKAQSGLIKYKDLKHDVIDCLATLLLPVQEKYKALHSAKEDIVKELYESSKSIRNVAKETLREVRDIVGLRPLNKY